jgi:hypothetical protein
MMPDRPQPFAIISNETPDYLFKFRDNLLLEREAVIFYQQNKDQSALDKAIAAWKDIFCVNISPMRLILHIYAILRNDGREPLLRPSFKKTW